MQGGGPERPEYTSVTVQEPLQGPEGPRVQESMLCPCILPEKSMLCCCILPEKPPETCPHCCYKLTECLRRDSRALLLLLAVIALLILIVVSLAVSNANWRSDEREQTSRNAAEDRNDGEVLPPCGDDWIWYRNKCYYFSEGEGTWTEAKDSCAALNSSLATIDTQKELDFLLRHKGDPEHWIGLWRDSDKRWRCINGTAFNNWFPVADHSDYAYLNHNRVKSGESYNTRHWICNKVSTYERKYKREKTVPCFR